MTKAHIISEIQRTAAANAGVPLGRLRFFAETGIKESDWRGVHWVRWNDAVREAGLAPNKKTQAYDDEWLITKLIAVARELGRFPVSSELRLRAHKDEGFPSDKTFRRLGLKSDIVLRVAEYCRTHQGFDDVLAMCGVADGSAKVPAGHQRDESQEMGFVYLLKSGRFYKVGMTNSAGRRERELAIQLPERALMVHSIRTDDPSGIEAYWHSRFGAKRKNGEWFALDASDVAAFKRRRFM